MKIKILVFTCLLGLTVCLGFAAVANTGGHEDKDRDNAATSVPASHAAQDDPMRLDGEKRFRANCGRCHTAPPKFPSHMMATIVRHMRVRATLTDEDARLILHYMTQ